LTVLCHRTVEQQKTVNQRHHNRYRLAALVSFSWETEDHRVQYGHGRTRDCSVSGAFVVSPNKLSIGSVLQMEFSLPRLLAAGSGARLRTRGRVVRIEADGFAVLAELSPGSLLHGATSMPVDAMRSPERMKPIR